MTDLERLAQEFPDCFRYSQKVLNYIGRTGIRHIVWAYREDTFKNQALLHAALVDLVESAGLSFALMLKGGKFYVEHPCWTSFDRAAWSLPPDIELASITMVRDNATEALLAAALVAAPEIRKRLEEAF